MIDFLIAHAQEAFAEKAAFVPPPQDGDDGSANELEEPDNPSDFYPKCASSVAVFSSFPLQAGSLSHCTRSSDCSCLIVCELANLFAGPRSR